MAAMKPTLPSECRETAVRKPFCLLWLTLKTELRGSQDVIKLKPGGHSRILVPLALCQDPTRLQRGCHHGYTSVGP